jgi:hypothetical protein
MPPRPPVDFATIRAFAGSQQNAFEEFCCQIARRDQHVPAGSAFTRYHGAGGDGGVECVWELPSGEEWGWQAKYLERLKEAQIIESFTTALDVHPQLTRYTICFPFDVTGPTRRGGRSESAAFEALVVKLEAIAALKRRTVEVCRLGKSELLDRILAMPDAAIRLRFWFDEKLVSNDFFVRQVTIAARSAEPRYSSELNVSTPLLADLDAFGTTSAWQLRLKEEAGRLRELSERWERRAGGDPFSGDPADFPASAASPADRVSECLREITRTLELVIGGAGLSTLDDLRAPIDRGLESVRETLPTLVEALEARHGAGSASSVAFRQFQAEYQVSFPARHVDAARDIERALDGLATWVRSDAAGLPFSRVMLVTGDAGVGKTHAVCDAAVQRVAAGNPSVVLFGSQFSHVSGEPWQRLASLLGFAAAERDDVFAVLNIAGEIAGKPCVVFLDALNETEPRVFWRDSLVSLVADVERFSWVRLCLTCRSTYVRETIPSTLSLATVQHDGFSGVEHEACFAFFRYYGLDAPSMPLMAREFSHPLFLRIVCESLRDEGRTTLPAGMLGLREATRFLLEAKNTKLAELLDYDPRERRVQRALSAFVQAAATARTRVLPWDAARTAIDGPSQNGGRSRSLFDQLVREGILREERYQDAAGDHDVTSITFERLGDMLLADALVPEGVDLDEAFAADGSVLTALQFPETRTGLLEALAIVLPERFHRELPTLQSTVEARRALVRSLIWRTPESISDRTIEIVVRALESPDLYRDGVEALLGIAARPNHPLNADWFHDLVVKMPLPVRDGWLAQYLHMTYSERAGVHRLLSWAVDRDDTFVPLETARLWLTTLAWFCVAADRRVRDEATIGMVRLMERQPATIAEAVRQFGGVNDDYVIERVLAAAYGALLRIQQPEVTTRVASAVFEEIFRDLPANSLIRDFARSILEFALHTGVLDSEIDPQSFRPPYASAWPLVWPTAEEAAAYKDSYQRLPKLYRSCFDDDFERYTVRSALRDYTHGVDEDAVLRWIFFHVLELGYETRQIVNFDRYLLATYGPGRARPSWAERIGKKYQWVAFYRVLGHIKDHVKKKRGRWDPPPPKVPDLQAVSQRNLDPSVVIRGSAPEAEQAWWAPVSYDFSKDRRLTDAAWLDLIDFPSPERGLAVSDSVSGRRYYVLQAYLDWTQAHVGEERTYPYRHVYMQIRSYLVPKRSAAKTWRWLHGKNFMDRWMPEGSDLHGGFLGEYPFALPFRGAFSDERRDSRSQLPGPMYPTVYTVSCEHGFDAFQSGMSVFVPSPRLLGESVRWNGLDGYESASRALFDPSIRTAGPQAFLADAEYIDALLSSRELSLMWTALSEKQAITGMGANHLGYTEASHIARVHGGTIEVPLPLTKRVK